MKTEMSSRCFFHFSDSKKNLNEFSTFLTKNRLQNKSFSIWHSRFQHRIMLRNFRNIHIWRNEMMSHSWQCFDENSKTALKTNWCVMINSSRISKHWSKWQSIWTTNCTIELLKNNIRNDISSEKIIKSNSENATSGSKHHAIENV